MAAKQRGATAVEKKLVGVADVVITAAERRKDPTLAIPVRALSNVNFNARNGMIEMGKRKQARSFFNVGMAKKFMQTVLVADALCELQRADLTTSLREIYYRSKHTIKNSHENTLDTQDESDPLIEDLEVDRKSTRLNSSHGYISYAVFCLKKKKHTSRLTHHKRHCAYAYRQKYPHTYTYRICREFLERSLMRCDHTDLYNVLAYVETHTIS